MKAPALIAAVLLATIWFTVAAPAADVDSADGPYDFVFLTDAGPLLIRVHPHINGKPVHEAWNDFMAHLFRYLDVNDDGILSKQEAERAPPLDHILSGGLGSTFPGIEIPLSGAASKAAPTMKDLDANKDAKVTLEELSAYYLKQGFVPLQQEADPPTTEAYGGMMIAGTTKREPTNHEIGETAFNLLDTVRDGRLTKEELAAAPEILLRFDTNEEEIVTAKQLIAGANARKGDMSPLKARPEPTKIVGSKVLIRVPVRGQAPTDLAKLMQARYAAKSKMPKLTAAELVASPPDLEVVVRLGTLVGTNGRLELLSAPAGRIRTMPGLALLDQGSARTELRAVDAIQDDRFGTLVKEQFNVRFKSADTNGKGYVTVVEAAAVPLFARAFRAMDRDGDGKVTEQEFNTYVDVLQDMQTRANQACMTLAFTDLSASLFDLLDVNRDGRLCVRALRNAPALLHKYSSDRKAIIRADLPHGYRLTVRRGPASSSADPFTALFARIYGIGTPTNEPHELTAGPAWFRKMDRNRDGDVSRREWLGSEERFRQIDTDGDGLISAQEAQRFDNEQRKR